MNLVRRAFDRFSGNARRRRAEIFRSSFEINDKTKILDFGSENGTNIKKILDGTTAKPENVWIADLFEDIVSDGAEKYGFNAVVIDEEGELPFEDRFFDVVYCSSVIEHVTVRKEDIWKVTSGREFRKLSLIRQTAFAHEIDRIGCQYFIQTPSKWFPIESHTWLPLFGYLPRSIQLPILKLTNRFWVKAADPDFSLLNSVELEGLFPDARILKEEKYGFTKSLMAIRTSKTA
jgi:2-polyprenyl-3-methyl-5-hydroxy-6-metoxy-1,4-benzoquinol methylase